MVVFVFLKVNFLLGNLFECLGHRVFEIDLLESLFANLLLLLLQLQLAVLVVSFKLFLVLVVLAE